MIKGEPIIILLVEDDAAHAEIVHRNLAEFCVANRMDAFGFYWLIWNRFPE